MKKIGFILLLFLCGNIVNAQYFGQNKPKYKKYDFSINQSDHFDLYHYLNNEEVVDQISTWSETWYDMHSRILKDTFFHKNPIILYNNHADFQETTTISGNISTGTGGVTEAFKNRVVFPLNFTHQQTHHVLGHELVHAFQYHMVINGDSTSLSSLQNLPLWMVEGLAEYMSIGKIDPFTAMWMRSAVKNNDVPTIKDLNNPEYFPYRYGHVFWSFLTSNYGDEVIKPMFTSTAAYGLTAALDSVLNTDYDKLNTAWQDAITERYKPMLKGNMTEGTSTFNKDNAGRMNISPSLSPNGKYVTFWSEKDVLGIDLFLADASSGEIIKKFGGRTRDSHLDDINFIEASGTWASDSREFAYVGLRRGKNVIVIKEVPSGKTLQTISIKGHPAIKHLAWKPKSNEIVFSSLIHGQVDLYSYNIKSKRVERLTNNPYSEIMAHFNADGSKLTYNTDYRSYSKGMYSGKYTLDVAVMDMESKNVEILDFFEGADNLNPNFDHEGNILFISNRDGYTNIYKYFLEEDRLEQITDLTTGVSGISEYSPALTASTRRDRILFTIFNQGDFDVFTQQYENVEPIPVDPDDVDQSAAYLPFFNADASNTVTEQIVSFQRLNKNNTSEEHKEKPYRPKFSLDYIGGGTGIGVGNGSFGSYTNAVGGIDLLFSDILGNNQIFSSIQVNGNLLDAGGQVAYINRKGRFPFGFGISHIPLRTGFSEQYFEDVTLSTGQTIPAYVEDVTLIRIFDESLSGFIQYPFSRYLRVEAGFSQTFRSFRGDNYKYYYDAFTFNFIGEERERIELPESIDFNQFYTLQRGWQSSMNAAFVGDNAVWGVTSPLKGHRFRLAIDQYFGLNSYTAFLADGRKYFWFKPISLAFRATSYNLIERELNSVYPFYIGNMGFVRGYNSFFGGINNIIAELEEQNISFGQLLGSNIAFASAEVRLPFTGPKRLALIGSKFILSDIVLFADAGVAYNEPEFIGVQGGSYIAFSTGASVRINLFGALIVEPYFAYMPREERRFFGINLIPGW